MQAVIRRSTQSPRGNGSTAFDGGSSARGGHRSQQNADHDPSSMITRLRSNSVQPLQLRRYGEPYSSWRRYMNVLNRPQTASIFFGVAAALAASALLVR